MPCDHLISVRVDEDTKQRFRALAAREGVSESALLKRLLELAMMGSSKGAPVAAPAHRETRAARLYVRLSPSDRRLLRERARGRALRDATYVSVLVRAHLRQLAPLPAAELAALKDSATQIRTIGRLLNLFVRAVQRGAPDGGFNLERAKQLVRVCMTVREEVKDVIRANVASWETGHVE